MLLFAVHNLHHLLQSLLKCVSFSVLNNKNPIFMYNACLSARVTSIYKRSGVHFKNNNDDSLHAPLPSSANEVI